MSAGRGRGGRDGRSNRTFMELKCLPASRQIRDPRVLIVPLWN